MMIYHGLVLAKISDVNFYAVTSIDNLSSQAVVSSQPCRCPRGTKSPGFVQVLI